MVQKGTKDGFNQSQTSCHKAFLACIHWPETWNCNHECCTIRIVTRFFLNSPWLIFNTGPRDLILQVPSSDDAFPLLEVPSGFLLGDISCGFTKKQQNLVLKNCDLLYFYDLLHAIFSQDSSCPWALTRFACNYSGNSVQTSISLEAVLCLAS